MLLLLKIKKNTLLLTVIAVATLLVAVVGATFAYFSLTVKGTASTTATVTTAKVPTVTVSSETSNLYLKVNASEMAQDGVPKYYYAKNADCPEADTCNTPGTATADDSNYFDVIKVDVSGGEENANYTCTGTVKVTSEDLEDIEGLTATDITIGLKNLSGNDDTATVDANVVKEAGAGATQNLNFKFTGNSSKIVKAYVLLTNRDADQSYLAGKTLNFTISSTDVKCTIDAPTD